jgi:DNA-binding CsgD family transcriptional regulator
MSRNVLAAADRSVSARPTPAPRWVAASIDKARAARGNSRRFRRVFHGSSIPMVIVDGSGRFTCANTAARLSVRLSLKEFRRRRFGDLASVRVRQEIHAVWAQLVGSGRVAGCSEIAAQADAEMVICYFVTADVLPEQYLAAFVPAAWPEDELLSDHGTISRQMFLPLTGREREVLELAADGLTANRIADELVISPATARTHLRNIYAKLEVRDKAAAVATGIRLGLIT